MTNISQKLSDMGIVLPSAPPPAANYVPYVRHGDVLYISGQLPMLGGELMHPGRVGDNISVGQATAAAQQCAINILAQCHAAIGIDNVKQIIKLTGFVCCTNDFQKQPTVINGASDFFGELIGEPGRHSRSAVGTNALPLGSCVEIEAIIGV